jgi:hypothetical protein
LTTRIHVCDCTIHSRIMSATSRGSACSSVGSASPAAFHLTRALASSSSMCAHSRLLKPSWRRSESECCIPNMNACSPRSPPRGRVRPALSSSERTPGRPYSHGSTTESCVNPRPGVLDSSATRAGVQVESECAAPARNTTHVSPGAETVVAAPAASIKGSAGSGTAPEAAMRRPGLTTFLAASLKSSK